jgi:hypothetical protein
MRGSRAAHVKEDSLPPIASTPLLAPPASRGHLFLRRLPGVIVGLAFLGAALAYFLSALWAIVNFAWRQPMFDQWRMYGSFLTLPFPQNVFHLENEHRPVVPNLVRYLEVQWFAGDQTLQIAVGTACAAMSVIVLAFAGWRERSFTFPARCAAALIAVLTVFWLGNARMLMHGNESLQVYSLVLCVIVAASCAYACAVRQTAWPMIGASAACTVAMFCFGSGVASFPALIALGVLLRIRWRLLMIPAVALTVLLVLYLFVLPSDEGVRSSLSLRPWLSIKAAMTWLSSPWALGWLSLADPPLAPSLPPRLSQDVIGAALVDTANAATAVTGLSWRALATLLGFAGAVLFAVRCVYVLFRARPMSHVETLATMLCLFTLATSFVIGIGRLDYLQANPDQVFADRYLLWSSLFWGSLLTLLLTDACAARHALAIGATATLVAVLALALQPTHAYSVGWSATVYQISQQIAASARSGLIDVSLGLRTAENESEYKSTLALFRETNLAMFSNPAWHLLGSRWDGEVSSDPDVAVYAHWLESVDASGTTARHLEGAVQKGLGHLRHGQLALIDDDDRIAGFAEFSRIADTKSSIFFSMPRKRGFDGYVAFDATHRHFRLVWLEVTRHRALLLADLPQL